MPMCMRSAMAQTTSELLEQLLAGQRALAAQMVELQEEQQMLARRWLATEDQRDLAALLPLAYARMGSRAWTAVALSEAAVAAADTALCVRLRAWVTESGGLRSFGRFLGRVSDCACGGLRIVSVGSERDGVVYVIRRLSDGGKPVHQVDRGTGLAEDVPVTTREASR